MARISERLADLLNDALKPDRPISASDTGQAYRAAIDILAKHFGLETPPITGTVQETHL